MSRLERTQDPSSGTITYIDPLIRMEVPEEEVLDCEGHVDRNTFQRRNLYIWFNLSRMRKGSREKHRTVIQLCHRLVKTLPSTPIFTISQFPDTTLLDLHRMVHGDQKPIDIIIQSLFGLILSAVSKLLANPYIYRHYHYIDLEITDICKKAKRHARSGK